MASKVAKVYNAMTDSSRCSLTVGFPAFNRQFGVGKVVGKRAQQYEAPDPYYEVNETGKRHKRPLPEGLTKEEAKVSPLVYPSLPYAPIATV